MALADGLAIRGEKVLVIDLDSQMNLSMLYGNFHLKEKSIFNNGMCGRYPHFMCV